MLCSPNSKQASKLYFWKAPILRRFNAQGCNARMIRITIRFTHHRHSNSFTFPRSRELLTFFLSMSSAFVNSVHHSQARQSLQPHALYIPKNFQSMLDFPMSIRASAVMQNVLWMMRIVGILLSPIHVQSGNMISWTLVLLFGLPDHPLPLHLLHVEGRCFNAVKLTIIPRRRSATC